MELLRSGMVYILRNSSRAEKCHLSTWPLNTSACGGSLQAETCASTSTFTLTVRHDAMRWPISRPLHTEHRSHCPMGVTTSPLTEDGVSDVWGG